MAAHLAAVTADGGIPLFTRKLGDVKQLPFAAVGTLNGVHLFSRLRGATLQSTITNGAKALWRTYHDSVVLLVLTCYDGASDDHLERLLNNVFGAMVMVVGLDALKSICNPDRLKRDLRGCYCIVDRILTQLDQDACTVGDLTGTVDTFLCTESQILQGRLDAFTSEMDTLYGCLLVRGKVAVATKQWCHLTWQEISLISTLVNSSTKCTSRDVAIYLPSSCPTVCNRLVTLQLTQAVELCLLCGPAPSLTVLEEEVYNYWADLQDALKSASNLHPRNFPLGKTFNKKMVAFPQLDSNVLGFTLINAKQRRSLTSVHPLEEESTRRTKDGKCVSLRRRQEIIRSLYRIVVGTFFPSSDELKGAHRATEVYLCTEVHKSYVIRTKEHQLFLLFSTSIPTFAMRFVAYKTLKSLTQNKVCTL
uniref:Uncharacterized protein n=2 Tax=Ornithodoros turicata TaxID=34597 RepID=A0A2R5LL23_9ACAR